MNSGLQDLPLFQQTEAAPAENKYVSVSQLTAKLRGVVEPTFNDVWLKGEITSFRGVAPSGHAYFGLKDEGAVIQAAIFGWSAGRAQRKAKFELKEGLQILCHGKIAIYPPKGGYQIVIDQVEPVGAGALQVAFEQLKAKLQGEGLFDPARKRPLPKFPKKIAIVTSPSGAAIRDIINVLKRRAPHLEVLIIPAVVQGEQAAAQVAAGVRLASQHKLGEIILVTRGGGSVEDLFCFNDEALARAISASEIPVVSAVGHEIDFTISDFVADLRAPTPSAGAEIITGHWVDVARRIQEGRERLRSAMLRDVTTRKTLLSHIRARLVSPKDRLREQAQRVDELHDRLTRAMKTRVERRRLVLEQAVGKLDALSPLKVLDRGYALVRERDAAGGLEGKVARSAKDLVSGQTYGIKFKDGDRIVRAE